MASTPPAEGFHPALAALPCPMVCAQDSRGLPSRLFILAFHIYRSQQTTLKVQCRLAEHY